MAATTSGSIRCIRGSCRRCAPRAAPPTRRCARRCSKGCRCAAPGGSRRWRTRSCSWPRTRPPTSPVSSFTSMAAFSPCETAAFPLRASHLWAVWKKIFLPPWRVGSISAPIPRLAGKSTRGVWLALLLALGALRVIATYPVFSHTYDEPAHLAAGMELLDRGTYTYEQLHPPLARVAIAIGPHLLGAHSHHKKNIYDEGVAILYAADVYSRILTSARLGV